MVRASNVVLRVCVRASASFMFRSCPLCAPLRRFCARTLLCKHSSSFLPQWSATIFSPLFFRFFLIYFYYEAAIEPIRGFEYVTRTFIRERS